MLELAGCTAEQVLHRLDVPAPGLPATEVEARRQRFGPNRVAHDERETFLRQFVQRLLNPLNILLIVLAGISTLMGDHEAAALIIAHNHPSGSVEPSRADELMTKTLGTALALMDVRVLDHIIVAGGRSLSFAQRGLL